MKRLCSVAGLVAILLTGALAAAQTTGWEVAASGAYMMPNNFNMPEYAAWGGGVSVGWRYRFDGDEWWERHRKHPVFGVRATAMAVPRSVSGHWFGVAGYVQTPLWKSVDYHWGLGLSVYSRSAYFTHDTTNIFITTLLNCLIDIGLDVHLTDAATLGLSFMHTSNGMLHFPNKGLNYFQLGLSYGFPVWERRAEDEPGERPSFGRHEVGFTLSPALARVRGDWSKPVLYPCYDVSLNYQAYLNPVLAAGGAVDLWFNGHHWYRIQEGGYEWALPVYVSALGYLEGFWGHISLKGGIGPVLLASPLVSVRIYERAGVYYNWSNSYVGVAINAHAGMAEFIEWSYGYRWKVK